MSDCKYPSLWKKPNDLYLSSWVIHGSCVGQSWVSLEKWGDKLGIFLRWSEHGAARGQSQLRPDFQPEISLFIQRAHTGCVSIGLNSGGLLPRLYIFLFIFD